MNGDYPSHREADVVLHDGSTVRLRPVRPGDEEALRRFFEGLSSRSRAFRFFSAAADLGGAAKALSDVDYHDHYGLVAVRGEDEHAVGHGVYTRFAAGRAEVAFAVDESMQGHGLGTILLAHLAEVAEENGIATFVAEVLPQNHRMIEMFRESGLPVDTLTEPGFLQVEMPTSFSPEAVARFEDRDRLAARAAIATFLEPRSVALVGASRRPGSVGAQVLSNMLGSGYPGPIYAVNPSADSVGGLPAYHRLAEVPGDVDLAVIAVPAAGVLDVAHEAAAKGARALLVLSAGFAETGSEGVGREAELLAICREAGMRLVGPNCLGVLNTSSAAPVNASFVRQAPPPGNVGFATQSGALALALADFAEDRQLGVSSFASVGNRADITANDFLEFWEEDGRTEVALLYIESFTNPRRFSRVARRLGRRIPVVAVKSGRSAAGARATASHTGALIASSDRTVDALFEQSGVIRAETLEEMLDVAALLSAQPLPTGGRVGIVTNAGGPAIMCADACEAAGLEIPEVPEEVRERLRAFTMPEASLGNPVDLIASASAEEYRRAITELAAWTGIDALIAIFIRPLATTVEDVAAAIHKAVGDLPRPIPVQAVFMSPQDRGGLAGAAAVPTYQHPEDAARALGKAVRYAAWRERPEPEPPSLSGVRVDEAAALLAEALQQGREWLGIEQCAQLLDCYGIAAPPARVVSSAEAAGAAAAELGGAVALKAQGAGIIHKSELGAVEVGLSGPGAVEEAARRIASGLAGNGLRAESFLVQGMVAGGTELLVGVGTDPVFGPVVACGAGGTSVELLGDVATRVCPLTAHDASQMIRSLASFPLLTGFRGSPHADLGAIEDLILRVSAMATNHPAIVELDLNPVIARPDGAVAADVRIRIAPPPPPRSWPRTWR